MLMDPAQWLGRKIRVYDIEIENEIGKVVGGRPLTWNDHDKMGISSLCVYDYFDGDYKVYLKDGLLDAVKLLNESELVVGFNQLNFDNPVVVATGYALNLKLKNYDILTESRYAAGYSENNRLGGLRLDDHLKALFGESLMKTGNGAHAPELFQQGKLSELINYNMADVRRTVLLFEHITRWGWVVTERHGVKKVRSPLSILGGIQ